VGHYPINVGEIPTQKARLDYYNFNGVIFIYNWRDL